MLLSKADPQRPIPAKSIRPIVNLRGSTMPFHISRDGQLYGPYSLEELHRYIASGHVLTSDLLRDDAPESAMPNWIPVAQFLAAQGHAAPPSPPFSGAYPVPPSAVSPNTFPDPPNLPWLLALLIGLVTGGTFFLVWDIVLASWAKRVEPASKALLYYIAGIVLLVLNLGSSWGVFISSLHHQIIHGNTTGGLLALASWVVRLIARFSLRDTLETHFNGPEPLGLRLSAVMTFFFGGLYFQYKLNRVNEAKNAIRYAGRPL